MTGAPIPSIYGLDPRDLPGAMWGPYFDAVFYQAAAATIETSEARTSLPVDQVVFYTNAMIHIQAGGAQTIQQWGVDVRDLNDNFICTVFWDSIGAAGLAFTTADRHVDFCLDPNRHKLVGWATFSAGAIANYVGLEVCGYLIPRGNTRAFP